MDEITLQQSLIRGRLEWWIENNEKPNWFSWFGFYPAKASVNAAKAQLKAMTQYGLVVSTMDAANILLLDNARGDT